MTRWLLDASLAAFARTNFAGHDTEVIHLFLDTP